MKKILLSLAVCLGAAFSAQAQEWTVGGRIGSGLQAVGSYSLSDKTYVEGRIGLGWFGGIAADVTALHMWNIMTMDWTPSAGQWFFDAGAGVNGGGGAPSGYAGTGIRANFGYVGGAGCAKLGIKFNNVPIRLAFDWTPVFGVDFVNVVDKDGIVAPIHQAGFYGTGLGNFGISCEYCF